MTIVVGNDVPQFDGLRMPPAVLLCASFTWGVVRVIELAVLALSLLH